MKKNENILKNYYKVGQTFINGIKCNVYENNIYGNEVDWVIDYKDKLIYKNLLDVDLI